MQTVGLHDRIELYRTKEPGIRLETNLFYLPNNEQNLAYRAAALLMEEFGVKEGVSIKTEKVQFLYQLEWPEAVPMQLQSFLESIKCLAWA